MPKSVRPTGRFDLRIVILRRVLGAAGDNNEKAETWPDPDVTAEAAAAATAGAKEYFAARENMSAGETIAQGLREPLGTMKLRIKGRAIPVDTADRIRKKFTGEVFNVTGVMRESADTIILCERLHQQTTGQ